MFQSSLCSEMASELKFAFCCHGSTRPAKKKQPSEHTSVAETPKFLPLGPYPQYGFISKEPLA